jgi:tetratricopeptide (TPR) repeat protein
MQSRRAYEAGLDVINMYRGDPSVFVEGLRRFQASRSCSYAQAGVAYTLAVASFAGSQTPDRRGLQNAMQWLERSQNYEPDRSEINFIEAVIYLNGKQFDKARMVLDYLTNQDPQNYYLIITEMEYWDQRGDEQKYFQWADKGLEAANQKGRQIFVMNSLAGFYLSKGDFEKSINVYLNLAELDPDDPWLWHNLSVMYVELEMFKEANQCNKQALSIMDFGAAREIEQVIKKNRSGISRLFGR